VSSDPDESLKHEFASLIRAHDQRAGDSGLKENDASMKLEIAPLTL
jgi:hypothetical protein